MKKLILVLSFLIAGGTAHAQLNTYDFESYRLEEEADYRTVEPIILAVADLLLSTPINENATSREEATGFLYNWMIGTPDYVFGTGRMRIILGEDSRLMGISFAAQIKYALENQASVRNEPVAQKEVWLAIARYISNKENNVSMTPKLRELVSAYKTGKLDEFMKKHE